MSRRPLTFVGMPSCTLNAAAYRGRVGLGRHHFAARTGENYLVQVAMCSCYLRVLSVGVNTLQKKNLNLNGFAVQPAPLLPCTCSSLSIPHLRAFNDGLYGPSADLQVRSLASVFVAMIVLTQSILASVLVAMSACVVSVSHALYRTLRRL